MKFCVIFSVFIFLTGCQALQDNAQCWNQVNQQIPAQTQQRYIRTDTQCNSSSSSLASPTTTRGDQYIVNGSGQTNCTSTPIYETIVLNQAERNAAYQQCRGGISNQRAMVESYQAQRQAAMDASVPQECRSLQDQAFASCMRNRQAANELAFRERQNARFKTEASGASIEWLCRVRRGAYGNKQIWNDELQSRLNALKNKSNLDDFCDKKYPDLTK